MGYPLNQWNPPPILADTAVEVGPTTARDSDGEKLIYVHNIGVNPNDEGVLYEHRITVSFQFLHFSSRSFQEKLTMIFELLNRLAHNRRGR